MAALAFLKLLLKQNVLIIRVVFPELPYITDAAIMSALVDRTNNTTAYPDFFYLFVCLQHLIMQYALDQG